MIMKGIFMISILNNEKCVIFIMRCKIKGVLILFVIYLVGAVSYEDVLLLFKCQVVSYFVNLMLHRLHLKAKQTSSFWDFTKSDGSISTLDWDSLSMLFSVSISMSSFSFSMVTSSALTTSTFSSLNVSWLKFEDLSYFNSLS